ncbi:hypothetical protein [Pseudomonas aeruginosa]|uniref:hypothetical protein n=1 Tax=Pseudomonas aeruginosa TaxID=287 RepID=UPI0007A8B17A|nr:hypothetical protein [Pseudomonas aeruginosa]KYO76066.1 hypothetical protein LL05_06159 [Pseudomonas aeruginosa]
MNKANECTCPSGDGSLVHPCPAHPAVDQAGGDERAAFDAYRDRRNALLESEGHKPGSKWHVTNAHYPTWEASRAALAQPSQKCATCNGTGLIDDGEITCSEGGIPYENGPVKCVKDCPDCKAQPSPAPELERPEGVAYLFVKPDGTLSMDAVRHKPSQPAVAVMTVAQHDRIVGELRSDRDSWAEQAEQRLADWDEMRKERDAALARVAELERQEPVALANRGLHAFWVKWTEAAAGLYGPGIKLYAAPVVQAQQLHDLDKQCRDDVARALGLRPNQERGFAWSYLLASIKSCVKASEDSAQAQHSVPEVSGIGRDFAYPRSVVLYLRTEPTDDDLRAIHDGLRSLAAAPGKEVPQAWLDVQAERRRQVEAEGWTPEHDDLYCAAELPRAAAAYILNGANDEAPAIWPFSAKWWKPRDARSNYVRASALILAEIERLDRAAPGKEGNDD